MKKIIIYLVALGFIVIGGAFVLAGASMADFDLNAISGDTIPTTQTYRQSNEPDFQKGNNLITEININEGDNVYIDFMSTSQEYLFVEYESSRSARQDITENNGVLNIISSDERRWFDYISIGGVNAKHRLTVYIPEKQLKSKNNLIKLSVISGSWVTIDNLQFQSIDLTVNGGKLNIDGVSSETKTKISTSSSVLTLKNCTLSNTSAVLESSVMESENSGFGDIELDARFSDVTVTDASWNEGKIDAQYCTLNLDTITAYNSTELSSQNTDIISEDSTMRHVSLNFKGGEGQSLLSLENISIIDGMVICGTNAEITAKNLNAFMNLDLYNSSVNIEEYCGEGIEVPTSKKTQYEITTVGTDYNVYAESDDGVDISPLYTSENYRTISIRTTEYPITITPAE